MIKVKKARLYSASLLVSGLLLLLSTSIQVTECFDIVDSSDGDIDSVHVPHKVSVIPVSCDQVKWWEESKLIEFASSFVEEREESFRLHRKYFYVSEPIANLYAIAHRVSANPSLSSILEGEVEDSLNKQYLELDHDVQSYDAYHDHSKLKYGIHEDCRAFNKNDNLDDIGCMSKLSRNPQQHHERGIMVVFDFKYDRYQLKRESDLYGLGPEHSRSRRLERIIVLIRGSMNNINLLMYPQTVDVNSKSDVGSNSMSLSISRTEDGKILVPRNVQCHRDISRLMQQITNANGDTSSVMYENASKLYNKKAEYLGRMQRNNGLWQTGPIRYMDRCGGMGTQLITTGNWNQGSCINDGKYTMSWTLENQLFSQHQRVQLDVLVNDTTQPIINIGGDSGSNTPIVSKMICLVDKERKSGSKTPPKLCPMKLIDYYIRYSTVDIPSNVGGNINNNKEEGLVATTKQVFFIEDNCDERDDLRISFLSKEHVTCGDTSMAFMSSNSEHNKKHQQKTNRKGRVKGGDTTPETDSSKISRNCAELKPKESFDIHTNMFMHEECTTIPDSSIIRYIIAVSDSRGNIADKKMEFTLFHVTSASMCPIDSIAFPIDTPHVNE